MLRTILTLTLLLPAIVLAKPTIAVMDFDIEKNAVLITDDFVAAGTVEDRTKMLSSELITFIVNTRKFDVIERDRINSILVEQDFSSSGMVDSSSAIQMGKLMGTDYLVMGKVEVIKAQNTTKKIPYTDYVKHTTSGNMIVNMRIVDTHTGKIVSAKKVKTQKMVEGKPDSVVFLDQLKEDTVRKMVTEVIDGVFPIKVMGLAGQNVYLNRGIGAANFRVGDRLDVYQPGEDLIDPDTGEVLGTSETKVAEIVVTSIQSKKSVAEIVNLVGMSVPNGSICRKPVVLLNQAQNSVPPITKPRQAPNW